MHETSFAQAAPVRITNLPGCAEASAGSNSGDNVENGPVVNLNKGFTLRPERQQSSFLVGQTGKLHEMGTGWIRLALFLAIAAFFAALALDIAVPALVLSLMATSNWLVTNGAPLGRSKGDAV